MLYQSFTTVQRADGLRRQSQQFKRLKQEPVRISSAESVPTLRTQQATNIKSETPAPGKKLSVRDGSKYPEFRTSTIDVNDIPVYDPAGKPITEVDLDADVAAETKPWRVPGTDPTGNHHSNSVKDTGSYRLQISSTTGLTSLPGYSTVYGRIR